MSETKLEKARAYEEAAGSKVPADLRPLYHLSSRCGWMNDPNGFSFYGGKYHMFYQYYPYDNKWGPMHWAHAVSSDLLHWEYLPVILAPEEDYDGFGCFSGSCETLPDGRHLAIYTGVAHSQTIPGKGGTQTQNIAIGDGLNYEKYATRSSLPRCCPKDQVLQISAIQKSGDVKTAPTGQSSPPWTVRDMESSFCFQVKTD